MNLDMVMTYLDFVVARHRIWEKRQAGALQPWANDPILANRKFTNVFRVLDPGSQFFVQELVTADPRDTLARAILYRLTNRPEAWLALRDVLGRYPLAEDLNETTADVLCFLRDEGLQVFSGAYVIIPEPGVKGVDKARSAIAVSGRVLTEAWPQFSRAVSIQSRFAALRAPRGLGDFLAMQVLTDYGYAGFSQDEENAFVIEGPGSIKGAKAIFSHKPALEVIRWARGELLQLDISIPLPGGFCRPPSLMDTQNTLCEFSKYVRYMSSPNTGKPYKPAHPGKQPEPTLPPHWGSPLMKEGT